MKKLLSLVLSLLLIFSVSLAETDIDLTSMTEEELLALRLAVNTELGSRKAEQLSIEEGMTIAEIFPDPDVAKFIQDKLGKFSTKNVVTQEELDTIKQVSLGSGYNATSLEGVQYLHNLTEIGAYYQSLSEIPEWIGTLTYLKSLDFRHCTGITTVPDTICNLTNLKTLNLAYTSISSLPEDIGNLINLKDLSISGTNIKELPDSIYNLTLDSFQRVGLDFD